MNWEPKTAGWLEGDFIDVNSHNAVVSVDDIDNNEF